MFTRAEDRLHLERLADAKATSEDQVQAIKMAASLDVAAQAAHYLEATRGIPVAAGFPVLARMQSGATQSPAPAATPATPTAAPFSWLFCWDFGVPALKARWIQAYAKDEEKIRRKVEKLSSMVIWNSDRTQVRTAATLPELAGDVSPNFQALRKEGVEMMENPVKQWLDLAINQLGGVESSSFVAIPYSEKAWQITRIKLPALRKQKAEEYFGVQKARVAQRELKEREEWNRRSAARLKLSGRLEVFKRVESSSIEKVAELESKLKEVQQDLATAQSNLAKSREEQASIAAELAQLDNETPTNPVYAVGKVL